MNDSNSVIVEAWNTVLYAKFCRFKHLLVEGDRAGGVARGDTDQVHCGPGSSSMAAPDMVSTMLRVAGFERVVFHQSDEPGLNGAPGGIQYSRKIQSIQVQLDAEPLGLHVTANTWTTH